MARQYLYSDGWENQTNPQHCRGSCGHNLVTQSIRTFQFINEYSSLSIKKNKHYEYQTNLWGIAYHFWHWWTYLFSHAICQ